MNTTRFHCIDCGADFDTADRTASGSPVCPTCGSGDLEVRVFDTDWEDGR